MDHYPVSPCERCWVNVLFYTVAHQDDNITLHCFCKNMLCDKRSVELCTAFIHRFVVKRHDLMVLRHCVKEHPSHRDLDQDLQN